MKFQYLIIILATISFLPNATAQTATTENKNVYTLSEVDQKPLFSKGKMTSREFLDLYLRYPEEAIEQKLEGVVILSLTIESDGEVVELSILQGADQVLNDEALRVASLLPYYTPGYVKGAPVRTKILFPVSFTLKDDEPNAVQVSDSLTTSASLSTSSTPNPLFIVDGKKVDTNINLDAGQIESIRVVKGSKALELYGANAQDGVVIIKTKSQTDKY